MSVLTIPLDHDLVEMIGHANCKPGEVADYISHLGVPATVHVDRTDRVVAIDCTFLEGDVTGISHIIDSFRSDLKRLYSPAWGML